MKMDWVGTTARKEQGILTANLSKKVSITDDNTSPSQQVWNTVPGQAGWSDFSVPICVHDLEKNLI